MRVLAFTDVHCDENAITELKKKVNSADICICAGDFSVMGSETKEMLEVFNKFGKEILLIPGNHEDEKEVKKYCEKLEHITFIHKKEVEREGKIIIGYGGGGFSDTDSGFEQYIKKIVVPHKPIILVTHQPPYGTTISQLEEDVGSKSYRDFVEKNKVILHICGHLHEHEKKQDMIGTTQIINPGKEGMIISL